MQNPSEDTEWNDALRKYGIIPEKQEITENSICKMVDEAAEKLLKQQEGKDMADMTLDELDLLEDDEDERVIEEYRRKRMAEFQAYTQKAKFGVVREISADDWVQEVNKAGEGVYVVVHLYKNGIPLCALMNQHLMQLAAKFPCVKFLRGQAHCCMPTPFPDNALPTVMIYKDGAPLQKYVGPEYWGSRPAIEEVEWVLAKKAGAFTTELEADPRKRTKDVLMSKLKGDNYDSDNDDF